MNPIECALRRPVTVLVLMVALLGAGGLAEKRARTGARVGGSAGEKMGKAGGSITIPEKEKPHARVE